MQKGRKGIRILGVKLVDAYFKTEEFMSILQIYEMAVKRSYAGLLARTIWLILFSYKKVKLE